MDKYFFVQAFFVLLLIIAGGLFFLLRTPKLTKIDACIAKANAIGIDPNDNQRSEFIKNCYND